MSFFNKKEKKQLLPLRTEILMELDTAAKSNGSAIFVSRLYTTEDGEERLRHRFFLTNFKQDDLITCLEEYKKQVDVHLERLKKNDK